MRHDVRYLFAECPPRFTIARGFTEPALAITPTITSASRFCARPRWAWPAPFSGRMSSTHTIGQAGLLPVYLRESSYGWIRHSSGFAASSPFTTWGIREFSGVQAITDLGLDRRLFHPEGLEFFGRLNFLKAGIVWADAVNAVSPLLMPARSRRLNSGSVWTGSCEPAPPNCEASSTASDYEEWNPETDPCIFRRLTRRRILSGKRACKLALLEEMGLPAEANRPLLGIISRFAHQKAWIW